MNRSAFSRLIPCIAALCVTHVAAQARPIVTGPKAPVARARPVAPRAATPVKTTDPGAAAATPEFTYYLCVTGRSANLVAPVAYPMIRTDVVCFYEHRLGLYPRIVNGRIDNNGIPQKTNLAAHLAKCKTDIEQAIPDPNWAGLAVIDFEAWCPVWSRTGDVYRNASREYTRQRNPGLTGDALEARAKQEFADAGKDVMLETLLLGKRLRPNAKWGFYGYPDEHRTQEFRVEMPWLWENIDAHYPSLYHLKYGIKTGTPGEGQHTMADFEAFVRGNIDACKALAPDKPIYAFVWERYHTVNQRYAEQMLNPDDLEADLTMPKAQGANGLIIWTHLQDDRFINDSKNFLLQKTFPAVKRAYDAAVAAAAASASTTTPVRAATPVRRPVKKPPPR